MAVENTPPTGQPGSSTMPGPMMPLDAASVANFRRAGKDLALGIDDAQLHQKNADTWSATGQKLIGEVIQAFFSGLGKLAVYLLRGLYTAMGNLDPAFGAIAATVIGNMFDVNIDATAFASMTGSESRKQVGVDVGAALLRAMQGDAAGLGAGELEPNVVGAEKFLGVMANLAIEGWAMDLVGEAETLGHITNLGELNDRMASVMGLGRLSRTVLRPFVNTLIALPATWSVNKQYRPKMLSVPEAIAAVNRGDIDEELLIEIAARDGYGDDALVALRNAARKPLAIADAELLSNAGALQDTDVLGELRRAGYDADSASLHFTLYRAQLLHKFELDMMAAACEAYATRKIDEPKLMELLSATTVDTTTIARMHELASQKRVVNVLHLTRADVEQAVELEVLSTSDYSDWLHARGYGENDALTLELMLLAKMKKLDDARTARAAAAAARAADRAAKAQAAQAKRDAIAAEHADWTGTLAQAERLVVREVMPTTQYRQILIDHNLSAGDADALVTVAVQDRDARRSAATKRAAAAAKTTTPVLSLSALERATIMGALSVQQLGAELATRKYSDVDAAIIIDLVNDAIAARTAALARTAAAAARLAAKSINLGQVQKAVVDGVQSLAQYSAFLEAQKFDATSIATLVADMQVQLDNRALANARHAAAAAKLEASHLSLAQEEKAVADGILTLADYQGYLVAHDFDAADVAILTALLETKLPAPPLA